MRLSPAKAALQIALTCSIGLMVCSTVSGQPRSIQDGKFDEFGNINADDTMAHLDLFAVQLNSNPSLQGFIIGHNWHNAGSGWLLREGYGYIDYLVNKRGILASRLNFIEAEARATPEFELWLLPAGAAAPVNRRSREAEPRSPQYFDSVSLGPEGVCAGEFFISLYRLEDALKFFGEVLNQQPRAKAWIVAHPRPGETPAKTNRTIAESRAFLLKNYGVSPERILTSIERPRSTSCTELGLWVAPSNSAKADEAGFYRERMSHAEETEYCVRRVEFVGNAHVRDYVVRRKFTQQEGDVFSSKALETSLRNFNRLGLFYPVTLNDVEVRLDSDDGLIDITIYFRERPRARRSRTN
jgi:Surface antigen variable number repeat